jgi:hypothetical protein
VICFLSLYKNTFQGCRCRRQKDTQIHQPYNIKYKALPSFIFTYFSKMKVSPILIASFLSTTGAGAFTPASSSNKGTFGSPKVATTKSEISSVPSTEMVDKSLIGIDDGAQHDVFDPLSGTSPALTRNNKSEVWVPQVSD